MKTNPFPLSSRPITALAALLSSLVCGSALAQSDEPAVRLEGDFNVLSFNPAPGPRNFITTRGARSEGDHAFSVGFMSSYARRPFVVGSDDPDLEEIIIVENLFSFALQGTYTPIPQLQIGLQVPAVYSQGQGLDVETGGPELEGGVDVFGISDPELEVKYRILPNNDAMVMPGVALFATAPLGKKAAEGGFVGRESVTAGGRLIGDFQRGPIGAALNVGYRWAAKEAKVGDAVIGSHMIFGAAAGFDVSPVLRLVGDFNGATHFTGDPGTDPLEAAIALEVTPLDMPFTIAAGGGAGISVGAVSVPDFRGILGFRYTKDEADPDDDGLVDSRDQCPMEPEDKDGYEDGDGCPELDNDGDAIPDEADQCPNDAEDLDQFEDTDGCPEKDNDKDSIPDVQDRCPDEAEVVNGFEDEDGCPDVPDTDGDGVKDPQDECPNEAEDTDGFQDVDGCPDPDNDGDGIPDDRDECVDEAETVNGEDDEDGCPEDEEE